MELHITKIAKFTTKKDGTPLTTKDGRPYTSVRIQTQEHGERWLSGFENAISRNWKEGDTVEAEVEEKGEYMNFRTLKPEDKVNEKLEKVLNKLVGLSMKLDAIYNAIRPKEKNPYPTAESEGIDLDNVFPDEPNEDVPF